MCSVGVVGFYTAPTDMYAHPQILARVGPGTECAAIVTGVSADGRFVNLRVFPDQAEDFSVQGVGFGDDPLHGSFSNLIEHEEPAEGGTAAKEQGEADARRKLKRADKTSEKIAERAEEAKKKREAEAKKDDPLKPASPIASPPRSPSPSTPPRRP